MKKLKTNQVGVGLGNAAQYLIEEGEWVPTLYGATTPGTITYHTGFNGSGRWGRYTRINDLCFVEGSIGTDAAGPGNGFGGAAGYVRVSGFPFVSREDTVQSPYLAASFNIGYMWGYGLAADKSYPNFVMIAGTSTAEFFDCNIKASPNEGPEGWHDFSELIPYFWFQFSGWYKIQE